MERETLLATLIVLFGGLALQSFAAWPVGAERQLPPTDREKLQWLRLWWPVTAAALVAAWLCGWALSQPDPVPHRVGWFILVAPLPFVFVGLRACIRAVWSLALSPRAYGIVTVGMFRPRILIAPEIASVLDDRAIEAALAHERAHALHRDPLRIWLAQFAADLQWPKASAQSRLADWLSTLQCARDDEARAAGVKGSDLAAAVLGSLRFHHQRRQVGAASSGQAGTLPDRIERLLLPLSEAAPHAGLPHWCIAAVLPMAMVAAVALGNACGDGLIGPLLSFPHGG